MKKEDILKIAKEQGFDNACLIDTKEIVFDYSFRPYCEENLCGQYENNYSCPSYCGTPEEMEKKILKYKNALVLQMFWEFPDLSDNKAFKRSKKVQNEATINVIRKLREAGHNGVMIGSSGCNLCEPCMAQFGMPCKYPDDRFSCMSAYCIYVKKLADSCNMKYDYENGVLPFFSMYAFD